MFVYRWRQAQVATPPSPPQTNTAGIGQVLERTLGKGRGRGKCPSASRGCNCDGREKRERWKIKGVHVKMINRRQEEKKKAQTLVERLAQMQLLLQFYQNSWLNTKRDEMFHSIPWSIEAQFSVNGFWMRFCPILPTCLHRSCRILGIYFFFLSKTAIVSGRAGAVPDAARHKARLPRLQLKTTDG